MPQKRNVPVDKPTKLLMTHPCLSRQIQQDLETCLDSRIPRDRYLLDSLLSKYAIVSPESQDERRNAAFNSTRDDERLNARTNVRLFSDTVFKRWGLRWDTVVSCARGLIADCIGDYSPDIYKYGKFSGGAAVGHRRIHGDPWYKFNRKLTVTPNAMRHAIATIMCHPLWERTCRERYGDNPMDWVRVVRGNEGFTVPKNAKTDRFACKEPTGNMFLQSGIGRHIRTTLKRVGINLNDQTRNQQLAKLGSINGELATIDLKSASNSVTITLCYLLLNRDWYDAVVRCRSPEGKIDGAWHRWEMMSSMGNGYTFELESLLFWALSEAVRRLTGTPGIVSVYGDDIIAPVACSHALIAVLNYAGFRVNNDKSFIHGPMKESCGKHYHNGLDITPVYIRKPMTDTTRVIWFLNALRRWATEGGGCGIADDRVASLYFRLRRKYVDPQLWGGVRLSSITSLVTPHAPRRRLKLVTESKRIDGVGAVLRTFMYAGTDVTDRLYGGQSYGGLASRSLEGLYPSSWDPQVVYEMFGSVPMSCSMSRIATVADAISDEENSECFADEYGLFLREI